MVDVDTRRISFRDSLAGRDAADGDDRGNSGDASCPCPLLLPCAIAVLPLWSLDLPQMGGN